MATILVLWGIQVGFVNILFALFVSVFIQNANAEDTPRVLKDFETDGCTMFVEGTSSKPDLWSHCCYEHDLRYWFGGAKTDKDFSDVQLRECVRDVAGNFWANLIYNGVKFGGYSPVKFKYVWGWAWEPVRGKEPLTEQETQYVLERLNSMELDPVFRETFIKKYLHPTE